MRVLAWIAGLCVAASALAAEPPARVGRVSFLQGEVSLFGDPDEGWQQAALNLPVTSENSLLTEARARAEFRVGPSAIRLDEETLFDITRLLDDTATGFLQRGSINVRLRPSGQLDTSDAWIIETYDGRITLEGDGRYRIDAAEDGNETRISVFAGRARFESGEYGERRLTIDIGKQLIIRGGSAASEFRFEFARETVFDQWAMERDRQWDSIAARYAREQVVSPYMTGFEELDTWGEWIDEPEYGRIWAPRVVVSGWAPYRYGRWTHVRPWGWTWVDDTPWGFAPFHYGRWVQVRNRWCWWPGPYVRRPVYAPALVAWLGGPAGSISIGTGAGIGWFPLAPREHYIPRYSNDRNYWRRVNHLPPNGDPRPPQRYRNQSPGATVVPNNVFANGNPVGNHYHRGNGVNWGSQAPAASIELPRPGRSANMPDRRQENGRYNQSRPRFVNDTPPPSRAYRPGEKPQPAPVTTLPGQAAPGGIPPAASPGQPERRPRVPRQQPGSATPAPTPSYVPSPQSPAYVPAPHVPGAEAQPAPVAPERGNRGRYRSQEVQPVPAPSHVSPAGPPPGAVTPYRPAPSVAVPPVTTPPRAVTPLPAQPRPEPVTKPKRDDRDDDRGRDDKPDRPGKPRTAKD